MIVGEFELTIARLDAAIARAEAAAVAERRTDLLTALAGARQRRDGYVRRHYGGGGDADRPANGKMFSPQDAASDHKE